MMRWEPTDNDIRWVKMMVSTVKDGGIWAAPSTGLIYKFHHETKTLTLTNPELLRHFRAFVMHQQTTAAFNKIGWKTEEV